MREIIAEVTKDQTRIALVEDKILTEFYIERKGKERIVGNIYKGKVANILPGMQAAFIDIGLEKNAFLYVGDILVNKYDFEFEGVQGNVVNKLKKTSIKDVLQQGQEIMVQVLKEPIGTKGARVTTHVTLPGRTLVLMPTVDYIGVSRRIENEEERSRLKLVGEKLKPEGMGLIIRTAAEGKDINDFNSDIGFLTRLWNKIKDDERMFIAPRLIHRDENLLYRMVRDIVTQEIDKIVTDTRECYTQILELVKLICPGFINRIELYDKDYNIYDFYQVESQLDKALGQKVWLKSGGYLIFDQTEALTSIDVNTGKYVGSVNLQETVFYTNMEAAEAIAHQIRLRDIGGIIIIDFIDMEQENHKGRVLELLKQSLKKDRTKTNVLGFTDLGLVEMTRKKVRQRISSVLQKSCPYCHGSGRVFTEQTIALKIKKEIHNLIIHIQTENIFIEVHPLVYAELAGSDGNELLQIEIEYHKKIYTKILYQNHIEQYKVYPVACIDDLNQFTSASDHNDLHTISIKS